MVVAEPDIQDPTIPMAQPPTMNHFFSQSVAKGSLIIVQGGDLHDGYLILTKIGPKHKVKRKPLFPIQDAKDASPTVATWNRIVVLVFQRLAR
jgi:hypothetical protein